MLYSLVFVQAEAEKTLSIGILTELIRRDINYWGSLMAACIIGTIPVIVVFGFLTDYFTSGLTGGAIK